MTAASPLKISTRTLQRSEPPGCPWKPCAWCLLATRCASWVKAWPGRWWCRAWRLDGTLSTLQLIPPPDVAARLKAAGKPGKLNLPGHSVQGWFTVGEIAQWQTVYIVEGIGQAWACWQATGAAAVVAFGAGNMGKVATALRQNDDAARLVLVPDVGKEDDAPR
jgi:hypothetical protein